MMTSSNYLFVIIFFTFQLYACESFLSENYVASNVVEEKMKKWKKASAKSSTKKDDVVFYDRNSTDSSASEPRNVLGIISYLKPSLQKDVKPFVSLKSDKAKRRKTNEIYPKDIDIDAYLPRNEGSRAAITRSMHQIVVEKAKGLKPKIEYKSVKYTMMPGETGNEIVKTSHSKKDIFTNKDDFASSVSKYLIKRNYLIGTLSDMTSKNDQVKYILDGQTVFNDQKSKMKKLKETSEKKKMESKVNKNEKLKTGEDFNTVNLYVKNLKELMKKDMKPKDNIQRESGIRNKKTTSELGLDNTPPKIKVEHDYNLFIPVITPPTVQIPSYKIMNSEDNTLQKKKVTKISETNKLGTNEPKTYKTNKKGHSKKMKKYLHVDEQGNVEYEFFDPDALTGKIDKRTKYMMKKEKLMRKLEGISKEKPKPPAPVLDNKSKKKNIAKKTITSDIKIPDIALQPVKVQPVDITKKRKKIQLWKPDAAAPKVENNIRKDTKGTKTVKTTEYIDFSTRKKSFQRNNVVKKEISSQDLSNVQRKSVNVQITKKKQKDARISKKSDILISERNKKDKTRFSKKNKLWKNNKVEISKTSDVTVSRRTNLRKKTVIPKIKVRTKGKTKTDTRKKTAIPETKVATEIKTKVDVVKKSEASRAQTLSEVKTSTHQSEKRLKTVTVKEIKKKDRKQKTTPPGIPLNIEFVTAQPVVTSKVEFISPPKPTTIATTTKAARKKFITNGIRGFIDGKESVRSKIITSSENLNVNLDQYSEFTRTGITNGETNIIFGSLSGIADRANTGMINIQIDTNDPRRQEGVQSHGSEIVKNQNIRDQAHSPSGYVDGGLRGQRPLGTVNTEHAEQKKIPDSTYMTSNEGQPDFSISVLSETKKKKINKIKQNREYQPRAKPGKKIAKFNYIKKAGKKGNAFVFRFRPNLNKYAKRVAIPANVTFQPAFIYKDTAEIHQLARKYHDSENTVFTNSVHDKNSKNIDKYKKLETGKSGISKAKYTISKPVRGDIPVKEPDVTPLGLIISGDFVSKSDRSGYVREKVTSKTTIATDKGNNNIQPSNNAASVQISETATPEMLVGVEKSRASDYFRNSRGRLHSSIFPKNIQKEIKDLIQSTETRKLTDIPASASYPPVQETFQISKGISTSSSQMTSTNEYNRKSLKGETTPTLKPKSITGFDIGIRPKLVGLVDSIYVDTQTRAPSPPIEFVPPRVKSSRKNPIEITVFKTTPSSREFTNISKNTVKISKINTYSKSETSNIVSIAQNANQNIRENVRIEADMTSSVRKNEVPVVVTEPVYTVAESALKQKNVIKGKLLEKMKPNINAGFDKINPLYERNLIPTERPSDKYVKMKKTKYMPTEVPSEKYIEVKNSIPKINMESISNKNIDIYQSTAVPAVRFISDVQTTTILPPNFDTTTETYFETTTPPMLAQTSAPTYDPSIDTTQVLNYQGEINLVPEYMPLKPVPKTDAFRKYKEAATELKQLEKKETTASPTMAPAIGVMKPLRKSEAIYKFSEMGKRRKQSIVENNAIKKEIKKLLINKNTVYPISSQVPFTSEMTPGMQPSVTIANNPDVKTTRQFTSADAVMYTNTVPEVITELATESVQTERNQLYMQNNFPGANRRKFVGVAQKYIPGPLLAPYQPRRIVHNAVTPSMVQTRQVIYTPPRRASTKSRRLSWKTILPNGNLMEEFAIIRPAERVIYIISDQVPLNSILHKSSTLIDFNVGHMAMRFDIGDADGQICFVTHTSAKFSNTRRALLKRTRIQIVNQAEPIQLFAEITTHVPKYDLHRVGGAPFYKFCKTAIKQDNIYELVMDPTGNIGTTAFTGSGLVYPSEPGLSVPITVHMEAMINLRRKML